MGSDKKPLTATVFEDFTGIASDANEEKLFPVRDSDNKKLDASDLFSHFTANIIKEDVDFIR